MMREPPGLPVTMRSAPSRGTIVGAIDESGRFPGAMCVALALHETVHVRDARFRR